MKNILLLFFFFGLTFAGVFGGTGQGCIKVVVEGPIYELEDLDVPPQPIRNAISNAKVEEIPDKFLYAPRSLAVIFVVTKEGKVTNVQIERIATEELSEYYIPFYKQWKFEPGEIDGNPVNCRLRIPLRDHLSNRHLELLKQRANSGEIRAAVRLSDYYGFRNLRRMDEARKWLKIAAELGDVNSQCFLGQNLIYDQNKDNDEEGIDWLEKAAKAGDEIAIKKLKEIRDKRN